MKKKSEIFKYPKGKKIGEIVTMVSIIVLMIFILESEGTEIVKILITIFLTVFFIFMISYTYILNDCIELNSASININKKIGKSNKIRFNQIRRVTIREEESSVETSYFKLTIFGEKINNSIIVSDLDNQFKMINLLEDKGREFNFNVIHQNINGEIIKELKK